MPDSLTTRLRTLGDAVEPLVQEVTAHEILETAELSRSPDISGQSPAESPSSGRLLLTAAAALMIGMVIGAAAFASFNRSDEGQGVATQPDTADLGNDTDGADRVVSADDSGSAGVTASASSQRLLDTPEGRAQTTEPSINADWHRLRHCESTNVYSIDSGNTFYGAYQFTLGSWQSVGGSGNPANAPAYEQDMRAALLYDRRGSQPWPICGRFTLGPMVNPLLLDWVGPFTQSRPVSITFEPGTTPDQFNKALDRIRALPYVRLPKLRAVAAELDDIYEFGLPFTSTAFVTGLATVTSPEDELVDPVALLEDLEHVATARVLESARLTVAIPRLGIDEPALTAWRLDDLGDGVAVVRNDGFADWAAQLRLRDSTANDSGGTGLAALARTPVVIASSRDDWDLDQLAPGDRVTITVPSTTSLGTPELLRVETAVATLAESMHVDDLGDLESVGANAQLQGLAEIILAAHDPDDPMRRIIVVTQAFEG